MNNKIFNWGIIGPGRIAHNFAKGVGVIKDAQVYAIASRNKERADDFAKEYNVGTIYNSYEEIVDDPEVDAIYVATPHRFHFEQTLLALNAGKPVLCEKPLKRWIHADGSKLSMKDSIKIIGQLGQIAWVLR